MTTKLAAALMCLALILPAPATAQQATADIWRTFAQQLEVGAPVRVRLRSGQRFTATVIAARGETLLLQPRTRRPVEVQPVSYDAIQSLERESGRGMSSVKAAGIGVAAGVGAFLTVLAIVAATLD